MRARKIIDTWQWDEMIRTGRVHGSLYHDPYVFAIELEH
jgi:hypothetical protein